MKKKEQIQRWVQLFLLAVLAGCAIGIGGAVYLSIDVKIAGALMFTIGLYSICVHGLNLYTGKVGYLFEKKPAYLLELLIIWTGNLAGTFLMAVLLLCTRVKGISELAKTMCQAKIEDNFGSLLVLGIFCGFLMYVAVDGYAKTKNPIILFMGVATFILSGFEHCVADMFYFSVAEMWSPDVFLRVLVITLGNSIGGVLISLVKKIKPAGA